MAGRLEQAKNEFMKALEIEARNLASKFKLGVTFRRQGDRRSAPPAG